MKSARWFAVPALAGTVGIAAIAFWLSFASLSELAALSGVAGARAIGIPLVVDGLVVVSTAAAGALVGNARVYAWAVFVLASVASIVGNAVHAVLSVHETDTSISVAVAVTPPLALLLATHLSMMLVDRVREQSGKDRVADLFAHLYSDDVLDVSEVPLPTVVVSAPEVPVDVPADVSAPEVPADVPADVSAPEVPADVPAVPVVEVPKPRARRAARPRVAAVAVSAPGLVTTG